MNWYIGQEIVCIKTHSQGYVKRGQTFTIRGLRLSNCICNNVEIDVGINCPHKKRFHNCTGCKTRTQEMPYGARWFSQSLFAPLEYNQEAIDELLAVEEPVGK